MLREVHINSPLPHGSAGKKAPAGSGSAGGGRAAAAGVAAGVPPSAQQWAAPTAQLGQELENWAAEQEVAEDVFESDGEGGVRSVLGEASQAQAAAAGVSHPLARIAATLGGGSLGAAQPGAVVAPGMRRGPSQVYCDGDEAGEMQAEVSGGAEGLGWRMSHEPTASHGVFCFLSNLASLLHLFAMQSSFHDVPRQPASSLVQRFFSRPPAAAPSAQAATHPAAAHQRSTTAATALLPGDLQQACMAEAEAVEQLQQEVVALQQERARVARLRLELEEAAGRLEQEKAAFEKRKVGVGSERDGKGPGASPQLTRCWHGQAWALLLERGIS